MHRNRATAREFGIAVKRVCKWRKQKEQLQQMKERATGLKRARLDGGGRKTKLPELEEDLLEWLVNRRSNGLHVSRNFIIHRVLLLKESDKQQFCRGNKFKHSF